MTARLLRLYLQARPVLAAAGLIATLHFGVWLLSQWTSTISDSSLTPIVLPVVPAILIALTARSPFGETERAAGYFLPKLELANTAFLIGWSVLLILIASTASTLPDFGSLTIRNFAGYLGVALIGNRLFGPEAGWIPTGAYAPVVALYRTMHRPAEPLLAWPAWTFDERGAIAIAAALFLLGAISILLPETRKLTPIPA
jgi:cytochrome c biogenesis protein CcdA